MENISFTVDHTMRELFEYPDPTIPFIVWNGSLNAMPDRVLDCHWHNELEYCVLLSGELDYFIDGQLIHMRSGDAVFVNANALHMAKTTNEGEDAQVFTVSFLPSLLTGGGNGTLFKKYFLPILQSPCRGFYIENHSNDSTILSLLYDIYVAEQSHLGNYELMCLSIVSRLWNETLNYIQNHPEIILAFGSEQRYEQKTKSAISFIHEHFADEIRIEDIVRNTFVSRSELFRSFQRFMNQSPIEYLMEYRLAQAADRLMKTSKPIAQIATECGFSGTSYFGKVFRKKYGITPKKFRNS